MNAYGGGGSGGIVPFTLNLITGWRWVVSLTPRTLYFQGKRHRYPSGWLGGKSPSGRFGDEKSFFFFAPDRIRTPDRSACVLIIIPTTRTRTVSATNVQADLKFSGRWRLISWYYWLWHRAVWYVFWRRTLPALAVNMKSYGDVRCGSDRMLRGGGPLPPSSGWRNS